MYTRLYWYVEGFLSVPFFFTLLHSNFHSPTCPDFPPRVKEDDYDKYDQSLVPK